MPGAVAPASPPWYQRVSFWRSLAGMALALALGCAAVALETASELSVRSTAFYHRLQFLRSRIAQLRTQAANAERYLAALRAERAARADVNQVLSADDAIVIPLKLDRTGDSSGMVVISRKAGNAIVEIAGLPPPAAGATYVLWWLPARGQPIKVGDVTPRRDGRLSLTVPISPGTPHIAGADITLEPRKADLRSSKRVVEGKVP